MVAPPPNSPAQSFRECLDSLKKSKKSRKQKWAFLKIVVTPATGSPGYWDSIYTDFRLCRSFLRSFITIGRWKHTEVLPPIPSNHVSVAVAILWSSFLPLMDPQRQKIPKSGLSCHLLSVICDLGGDEICDRGANLYSIAHLFADYSSGIRVTIRYKFHVGLAITL